MSPTSATTFSPDAALTKGQLAEAFNAINGTNKATDNDDEVGFLNFAAQTYINSVRRGFVGFFKGTILLYNMINENIFNLNRTVTRAEAASILREVNEF